MNRYDRQTRVAEIGHSGQQKIMAARALIIGVGAIGSHVADALVRMGVEDIVLIDRDFVELTNLQRQTLFTEEDAHYKLPKAIAAKAHLEKINQQVSIDAFVDEVTIDFLTEQLTQNQRTFVFDCTDNFATRRLINEVCLLHHTPWIFASCAGNFANVLPIMPGKTACLTCLIGEVPQVNEASCELIGVNGALLPMLAGVITALFVRMTVDDTFEAGDYYQLDAWQLTTAKFKIPKRADCSTCGDEAKPRAVAFSDQPVVLCGRETVQFRLPDRQAADFQLLTERLIREGRPFSKNPYLICFQYHDFTFSIFQNGRVLLHGTSDLHQAKKAYHYFFE
ncbi:ThiF family adenylyltransferase [Listeria costaricensis]|uniref:ThiF family adenylyltransferase n=1 Tax=Listeria costaricensis TaxID=2026604 RepID=UPI000C072973|nr:ThiF family adenylyltransferase [Listeria costaricensis]